MEQLNPWKVRDKFLSVEAEPDSILGFLIETGTFFEPQAQAEGLSQKQIEKLSQIEFEALDPDQAEAFLRDGEPLTLDQFRHWQFLVNSLLTTDSGKWSQFLHTDDPEDDDEYSATIRSAAYPHMYFDWQQKYPLGVISTHHTLPAILGTVFVDALRGAKVRSCARADCRELFEVISAHERKYCSQYCGHLVSLRRERKKKREAKRRIKEWRGKEQ
jgi:hypothetical protein